MTRAQMHAHGLAFPSTGQLWLAAMLRAAAELVRNAALILSLLKDILRMACVRLSRDWHTDVAPAGLPGGMGGIEQKGETAAGSSERPKALRVSSERSSRRVYPELVEGSNREGGLTNASEALAQRRAARAPQPLIPAKAGTQGGHHGLFRLATAASDQRKDRHDPWIPAFAGTSGDSPVLKPRL